MNIEEMSYSKLSHPELVLSAWEDISVDLIDFGEYEIERQYLAAIDYVRVRTVAPNMWLADYIWRLERRISNLEQRLYVS